MDLIGNLFGRLKQAGIQRKYMIIVDKSDLVLEVLTILYRQGYISGFRLVSNKFEIYLKYYEARPVLYRFKRYSTYSKRYYCSVTKLLKEFRKSDFLLISTTSGILTKERAINLKLGGEVLI